MKKEQLLELEGDFTWDFGCHFFIETNKGNFIWSDPDYNGDNTIVPFDGNYNDWLPRGMYGRSKGLHKIGSYCGTDIIFKG